MSDSTDATRGGIDARPETRGPGSTNGFAVAWVLFARELLRFRRQPARIVAAVVTPLVFGAFMAGGFAGVFAGADDDVAIGYGVYLLPGTMTAIVMFSAIFSTISIIDDRREGWLQAVLVSPAPRWSIALGKVAGGAAVAWGQGAILLAITPLLGAWPGALNAILTLAALAITALALTAVGTAFAWRCETSQAFHAVMNLVFFPMWLLSGAIFPADRAADALGFVMRINPMTWCTEAIRGPMTGGIAWTPLLLALAFVVLAITAATVIVARPSRRLGG